MVRGVAINNFGLIEIASVVPHYTVRDTLAMTTINYPVTDY